MSALCCRNLEDNLIEHIDMETFVPVSKLEDLYVLSVLSHNWVCWCAQNAVVASFKRPVRYKAGPSIVGNSQTIMRLLTTDENVTIVRLPTKYYDINACIVYFVCMYTCRCYEN